MPDPLKQLRHALAQVEPWDYFDPPSADYQSGWNDAMAFMLRVLTAVENSLMCNSCGMPAHRGAGKDALDKLMAGDR